MKQKARNLKSKMAFLISLGVIFYFMGACGKKDKDDRASTPSQTIITASEVKGGKAIVKYQSNNSNPQFFCKIDNGEWYSCTSETQFAIQNGQSVVFNVKDGQNGLVTTATLTGAPLSPQDPVQGGFGNNDNGSNGGQQFLHFGDMYTWEIGIGGNRVFRIPEGMHMVRYSTNYTRNGALDVYEVLRTSDRENGLVTLCEKDVYSGGEIIRMVSTPNGQPYDYCRSMPRADAFKFWNEYKIGFNHIEVASDNPKPGAYESMSVSVFDSNFDWQTHGSRFEYHCAIGKPGVWGRGALDLPMENNYFPGYLPDLVRFEYCQKNINLGVHGQITIMIGSFRSLRCGMASSDITEFVYMADVNPTNVNGYQFARNAVERVLSTLRRSQPAQL